MTPTSSKITLGQRVGGFFKFVFNNLDNAIAIVLSIVGAAIAAFGGKLDYAIAAAATSMAILAYGNMKDRTIREQVSSELGRLNMLITQNRTTDSAEQFFSRKTSEKDLIVRTEHDILVIQETGRLIAETCRQELVSILNRGGRIRWVNVLEDNAVAELMALRNANLNVEEMLSRMKDGTRMLHVLAREARNDARRIEVRFFRYPVDITAIFKDPHHSENRLKEALVRLQGFHVTFDDKLDFRLSQPDSGAVYDLYLQQAEKIWQVSSKCILLTGQPAVGKSTLLRKVVERIRTMGDNKFIGFFTNDVQKDGVRIGFQTSNLEDPSIKSDLATKSNGSYTLKQETMTNIVNPILKSGLASKNKILVIDEIGPIQLQDKDFQDLIQSIIDEHGITVFGVVALEGHPFLTKIHNHIRTGIIEVTKENRDNLFDGLVQEFSGKLD